MLETRAQRIVSEALKELRGYEGTEDDSKAVTEAHRPLDEGTMESSPPAVSTRVLNEEAARKLVEEILRPGMGL